MYPVCTPIRKRGHRGTQILEAHPWPGCKQDSSSRRGPGRDQGWERRSPWSEVTLLADEGRMGSACLPGQSAHPSPPAPLLSTHFQCLLPAPGHRRELEVSQELGARGQGSEGPPLPGPPCLRRVTGLGCADRCRQPGALSPGGCLPSHRVKDAFMSWDEILILAVSL